MRAVVPTEALLSHKSNGVKGMSSLILKSWTHSFSAGDSSVADVTRIEIYGRGGGGRHAQVQYEGRHQLKKVKSLDRYIN